jgi:hypothetical protein
MSLHHSIVPRAAPRPPTTGASDLQDKLTKRTNASSRLRSASSTSCRTQNQRPQSRTDERSLRQSALVAAQTTTCNTALAHLFMYASLPLQFGLLQQMATAIVTRKREVQAALCSQQNSVVERLHSHLKQQAPASFTISDEAHTVPEPHHNKKSPGGCAKLAKLPDAPSQLCAAALLPPARPPVVHTSSRSRSQMKRANSIPCQLHSHP